MLNEMIVALAVILSILCFVWICLHIFFSNPKPSFGEPSSFFRGGHSIY